MLAFSGYFIAVILLSLVVGFFLYRSRKTIVTKFTKGLSWQWKVVLAFFLGASLSSFAQDPSDTIFFYAQAHNLINTATSPFFWYLVPFSVYFSLFLVGCTIARHAKGAKPTFLLYLFLVLVLCSAIVSLSLPQNSSLIYVSIVVMGTIISVGIVIGAREEIEAKDEGSAMQS